MKKQSFDNADSSGLYYKHILTILSDDRKWCLCDNGSVTLGWNETQELSFGK
jgi:hypothetical protein